MKKITAIEHLEKIQSLTQAANMPEPQRMNALINHARSSDSIFEFIKMAKIEIQIFRAWVSVKGHEILKNEADKFLNI
jgi:hypothetical protein